MRDFDVQKGAVSMQYVALIEYDGTITFDKRYCRWQHPWWQRRECVTCGSWIKSHLVEGEYIHEHFKQINASKRNCK